jgi:ComF family protein
MWPFICVLCGRQTGRNRICDACRAILPRVGQHCERCGQPTADELRSGVSCADCQRRPPVFSRARAPFHYAFPVDSSLKKLKYHGQLDYAAAFAELLLPLLAAEFPHCDALVPVPLHRWRHARRGFNQADEICRVLAAGSGLPVLRTLLRSRATRPQSGLSRSARWQNLRDAFAIRGTPGCRSPLIVDDVITTGATGNRLAAVLKRAGCNDVGLLAVARSGDRDLDGA